MLITPKRNKFSTRFIDSCHILKASLHTDYLIFNVVLLVAGLIVLVKGSDWFIDGAAHIAHHYHIPDVIIGLTLVSIGTSLPELATNIYAASIDQGAVALGNVVGSNIANTLLILGVAAVCMRTIPIARLLFNRDAFAMLGVTLLFCLFCYVSPGHAPVLSRLEGMALLLVLAIYVAHLFRGHKQELIQSEAVVAGKIRSVPFALVMLLVGGAFIMFGAKVMVDNVVWAAKVRFGIPEELVSATVIAFGTSVPELAVTVAGVLKGKNDIALGNVIGSNIFNLGLIMGITALISPIPVTLEAGSFLLPYMLGAALLLVLFMRTSWALLRWEGIVFLTGYLTFIALNIQRIL